MAEEVRIDLKSTADTSGAKQMGDAIGGLAGKSQGAAEGLGAAGKESKQLAGALGKNVEVGSQAVTMMGQLGNVSKGGAEGLAAAARSGLAFGQMIKGVLAGAGPIGIALTALTALGAAAYGLVKAFKAPELSAEELAKRFDAAKTSGEALAKVNFESMVSALKLVNDELTAQIQASKDVAAAQEEIATAMDKTAKTEIDNLERVGKITKERADLAKAGIEAGADGRAAQSRVASIQAEKDAYERALAKAESVASPALRDVESSKAELDSAESRRRALSSAEFELRAARESSRERTNAFGVPLVNARGWDSDPDLVRRVNRERRAEAAYTSAKQAAPDESSDVNSPRMKELRAEAEKAMENWKPTGESIMAMRAKIDDLGAKLQTRVETEAALATESKKQAKANQMKPATAKEQATSAVSDARMKELGPTGYMNRAATGGVVDADQFARVFPKQAAQMDALAQRSAAQPATSAANQLQLGGGALAPTADPRIQLGGGPLGMSQVGAGNQITRGQLQPGSDNTLTGAADKVADAASANESAGADAKEQLAKIGEGSAKIAENTAALTTEITTAATGLSGANESLASAITTATTDLATTMEQAITLGGQNVQAYSELSGEVRALRAQVAQAMSQLAAARSKK